MKLDFKTLNIKGLEWGKKTTVSDGVLYINPIEAVVACGTHPYIENITLHIARPGESVRIMPVKDVIEPRCKTSEEGAMFPGFVGELRQAGTGGTLALKGAAVVVTENNDTNAVCRTGGFIDMTGPAAEYSPFSRLFNLVVNVRVNEEAQKNDTQAVDDACKLAGLRLAVYLAEHCKDNEPDEVKVYETPETDPSLPGVVYVMQMLAQNPLIKDFYIYGQLAGATMIPTILHPNEILDGALVSFVGSHNTVCSDKQYMYEIQNAPAVEELYKLHGKSVRFLGVIVHNEVLTLPGKIRNSLFTSKIAKMLGTDGAVLVTEGHGNPDEDIMLNVKNLEEAGVKTVIISDELGGRDGKSPGLADWVKECSAMVSVGNTHELLAIPQKMDTFIGNEASLEILHVAIERQPEEADYFYTEMIHVTGACAQAGLCNLSAKWM
ncbi:glycine/sarcosine/betaine reductase component B subunit [Cloacibacillus porcorum]